jgi:flavin-dependent dehydrogenase
LAEKLNLPTTQHSPARAAVWGYYENAFRDVEDGGVLTNIFRCRDRRQWFWYVPLHGNVVSVGVVGSADHLLQGRGRPATVFEEELVECPIVLERLVDARLVGELRACGPFASVSRVGAGNGWVMVGDSLATLDPVFCTGVSLGLHSGNLAADAIAAAQSGQQFTGAALGRFLPAYTAGLQRLQRLAEAFYDPRFSFRLFLDAHPDQYGSLVDFVSGHVFDLACDRLIEQILSWLAEQGDGHAAESFQTVD